MRRYALLVFALVATAGLGAQTLSIADPIVAMSAPAQTRELTRVIDEAIKLATTAVADEGRIVSGGFGARSDASLQITAFDSAGTPMISLTLATTDGRNGTLNYASPLGPSTRQELAESIVTLFRYYVTDVRASGPPAVLTGLFRADNVSSAGLSVSGSGSAYSVDTDGNGDVIIGMLQYGLRTDRYFREQAKLGGSFLEQLPSVSNSFWQMVYATPAEPVVAMSTAGSTIWRVAHDAADPLPVRLPASSIMPSVLTDDGTFVGFVPGQQEMVRLTPDGEITYGSFRANQLSYPSVMAAGPESTVWVWDVFEGRIVTWSSDGVRLGALTPMLDYEQRGAVRHLLPYPDGSVLIVTNTHLLKFAADGTPVWTLAARDIPELGSMNMILSAAFDPVHGLIYLVDVMPPGKVYQLIDVDYRASSRNRLTTEERRIVDLYEEAGPQLRDVDALKRLAGAYRDIEAWELARDYWRRVAALAPNDSDARAGLAEVDVRFLMERARYAIARARRTLDELGPANARRHYEEALRLLEQLRALVPDNEEISSWQTDLEERFASSYQPARIVAFETEEIFPSLFARYQSQPVGTVQVSNPNPVPLGNVRLEVQLADYMATPWTSDVIAILPSEGSVAVPVSMPVSRDILELGTKLNGAPARVTIRYEIDGSEREATTLHQVVIHPNTALTWDDSGKLASFVTPSEQVVQEFSSRFQQVTGPAARWSVSETLLRAVQIADALGAYDIEYIQDPESGISTILGNPTYVDRVLFPRDTLRYRRGDCDDTTALLASLLESVSIRTAIMTSPDHVFLAMDTGEPEQNIWLFRTETTTAFAHGGTVWIPVETTILQQGFAAAWEEGSRLVLRYSNGDPDRITGGTTGQLEFLPMSDEWQTYPQLPLGPASFTVFPPPDAAIAELRSTSVGALRARLYETNIATLERELRGQSERRQVRTLNQVGILHARFGEAREAEAAFQRAIRIDDEYVASYLNLANLAIADEDARTALRWLDEAEERRPGGVVATLLRAQAEYLAGNRDEAAEYMTMLANRAPELAAQYPHLAGGSAGSRASEAQARPILPWSVETE